MKRLGDFPRGFVRPGCPRDHGASRSLTKLGLLALVMLAGCVAPQPAPEVTKSSPLDFDFTVCHWSRQNATSRVDIAGCAVHLDTFDAAKTRVVRSTVPPGSLGLELNLTLLPTNVGRLEMVIRVANQTHRESFNGFIGVQSSAGLVPSLDGKYHFVYVMTVCGAPSVELDLATLGMYAGASVQVATFVPNTYPSGFEHNETPSTCDGGFYTFQDSLYEILHPPLGDI